MAKKNWTQVSISKATGVHQSQISRFRSGDFTRLEENLRKVCSYAGVPLVEPLTPDDPEELRTLVDAIVIDLQPTERRALVTLLKALKKLI